MGFARLGGLGSAVLAGWLTLGLLGLGQQAPRLLAPGPEASTLGS